MSANVMQSVQAFFEGMNDQAETKALLASVDQTVRFLVEDGEPFRIETAGGTLRFHRGVGSPETKDHPDYTHFRTDLDTLRRLVEGEIRYSDAVIPSASDMGTLRLVEKWMFKKHVINWMGRLIRMRQEGSRWPGSRPTEGWKGGS